MIGSDLRKIELQVEGQQSVLSARLFQRNLIMGLRQFLEIVEVVNYGIVVVLSQSALQ